MGEIYYLMSFIMDNIIPVIILALLLLVLLYITSRGKTLKQILLTITGLFTRIVIYPLIIVGILAVFFFPSYLRVWNAGDFQVKADMKKEIRVAFMADFHISGINDRKWVSQLAQKTRKLSPDIILLGGDFVWDKPERLSEILSPLLELKPPLGTYAVLGNHDYGVPGEDVSQDLEENFSNYGVTVLHNNWVVPAKGLVLIGIDDMWAARTNLEKAFKNVPADVYTVVLAHNPDILLYDPAPYKYKANLWLYGHTHGGQAKIPYMNPPYLPTKLRLIHGLFDLSQGKVIVTQGAGQLKPRFFTNPEIVFFRLIPGEKKFTK